YSQLFQQERGTATALVFQYSVKGVEPLMGLDRIVILVHAGSPETWHWLIAPVMRIEPSLMLLPASPQKRQEKTNASEASLKHCCALEDRACARFTVPCLPCPAHTVSIRDALHRSPSAAQKPSSHQSPHVQAARQYARGDQTGP